MLDRDAIEKYIASVEFGNDVPSTQAALTKAVEKSPLVARRIIERVRIPPYAKSGDDRRVNRGGSTPLRLTTS
ncbi:hypothetical protein H6F96_16645 [Microcoleus sp. FACHB-53]|nr:hypothetical protein [Microcoleus sp. FACHB-53]